LRYTKWNVFVSKAMIKLSSYLFIYLYFRLIYIYIVIKLNSPTHPSG
jgi:hypothetical protein